MNKKCPQWKGWSKEVDFSLWCEKGWKVVFASLSVGIELCFSFAGVQRHSSGFLSNALILNSSILFKQTPLNKGYCCVIFSSNMMSRLCISKNFPSLSMNITILVIRSAIWLHQMMPPALVPIMWPISWHILSDEHCDWSFGNFCIAVFTI